MSVLRLILNHRAYKILIDFFLKICFNFAKMNLKNPENYSKAIEYLLLATLIGVPLFYDTNIYLTFDLSKALLLRLLTFCILWVGLARMIFFPPLFRKIGRAHV